MGFDRTTRTISGSAPGFNAYGDGSSHCNAGKNYAVHVSCKYAAGHFEYARRLLCRSVAEKNGKQKTALLFIFFQNLYKMRSRHSWLKTIFRLIAPICNDGICIIQINICVNSIIFNYSNLHSLCFPWRKQVNLSKRRDNFCILQKLFNQRDTIYIIFYLHMFSNICIKRIFYWST